MNHWLFKSEPGEFSLDDLAHAPKRTARWEGIRSSEARNLLRDRVKKGDLVLYYHSSVKPSAIVGIAKVVRAGYPDATQFDPSHSGHDPKSDPAEPTWYAVDIQFVRALPRPVTLDEVKAHPKLASMALVKRGRLSVQPVTPQEWAAVLALAEGRSSK